MRDRRRFRPDAPCRKASKELAGFLQALAQALDDLANSLVDGSRYAYRLTSKGFQVALLFLFFHKRLCGPLANSRFHHQPDTDHRPKSKLEAAYYKADRAIQDIVNLLDAA